MPRPACWPWWLGYLHRLPWPPAWLHPLLRLLYIGAYVGNVPPLRGLCWASGLLCSGILYLEGLKAVLQQ